MRQNLLKPIHLSSNASASIHANVSLGYYVVDPRGTKTFVPYDKNEMAEIHGFISPGINKYKQTKWKDKDKANRSIWKFQPTYGGLNTISK
jgi:hypothetical protein